MLIVAGEEELAAARAPVWGTGGWDPPETREARDWLCLARLCGWDARVSGDIGAPATRWIVLARDAVDEREVELLARRLEREALLAVARADTAWAALGSGPDAVRPLGRGAIATLGLHPSAARDADGAMTARLRRLLVDEAREPVECLDWSGTLVLRMDDPGSPESAHHDAWRYPKLDAATWRAIGDELERRDGRMTVAYTPGWVDDGDPRAGTLEVAGRPAARVPGAVHPSAQVRYRQPDLVHDLVDEHAGLVAQRERGVLEVELHGFTHVHPDRAAWAAAPDRARNVAWYRELVDDAEVELERGVAALQDAFGTRPRALVPPGDAWTDAALGAALDLGFDLVSSYYLALRDRDRWVWCQHVCAPYLDEPDPSWFDAGLPVVGYFHDMEPSVHGIGWLVDHLDAWQAAGARRLIDLRTLATAL